MSLSIGRPRFVTVDEALAWHELAIREYGGDTGIRDRGLLESALAQPQQQFDGEHAHKYPFGMAAAYAFFVAKNHPFVDGNKRVALVCCTAFLRMNGWNLESEGIAAADEILKLVEDEQTREQFAAWLDDHCRERPSMELRDFFAAITPVLFYQHWTGFMAATDDVEREQTMAEVFRQHPTAAFMHATAAEVLQSAAPDCERQATIVETGTFMFVALHRLAEDMGYEW